MRTSSHLSRPGYRFYVIEVELALPVEAARDQNMRCALRHWCSPFAKLDVVAIQDVLIGHS